MGTVGTVLAGLSVLLAFGSLASAIGQLLELRRARRTTAMEITVVESPAQRINRLIEALSEAANAVEEIEAEIRDRHELAQRLQEDIQRYERLRDVNQEEIEAVAQVLGGELRREGRRSFRTGFVLNLIFFILGVGATVILSLLFGL